MDRHGQAVTGESCMSAGSVITPARWRTAPGRILTAVRGAWLLPAGILIAGILLAGPVQAQQPAPPNTAETPALETPVRDADAITGIRLRKEGETLEVHFDVSRETPFVVVGNAPRQVIVVKFPRAVPAMRADQRNFLFNDPYLVGVAFEDIPSGGSWAKIRLRTPRLQYEQLGNSPSTRVALALKPRPGPIGVELQDIQLKREGDASRVELLLSSVPPFIEQPEESTYLVRLRGVTPQLDMLPRAGDEKIRLGAVERDGDDTIVSINLNQPGLRVNVFSFPDPPKVILDFRAPQPMAAAKPATPEQTASPTEAGQKPAPPADQVSTLLEAEQNPLVRANYLAAETEFRARRYKRARQIFMRVFDTVPKSKLGVRAFLRAADAQYEDEVLRNGKNFHPAIISYQSAIRAAENIQYEADLIPKAFYQIGRSYQLMGFHFESNVNYKILQEQFPGSFPFTPDSYYYMGHNLLDMKKPDESIQAFKDFFKLNGDPGLQGPAYYYMGEAYYQLRRYVDARTQFDLGQQEAPDFLKEKPIIIFHMGETYYENADFQQALVHYKDLINRFPNKSYTKLVGLRVGDFLREEGREEEALEVYQKITGSGPLELRLRAKLRMADLYSKRPVGEDYRRAEKLFNEVIQEGFEAVVSQEAMLRKALMLQLHGFSRESIEQFEKLREKFPKGPFAKTALIEANIEENLKSLVDKLFSTGQHFEVTKVYTNFRDRYFKNFRFRTTLFQVAQSYQNLGLFDQAIGMYGEILAQGAGTQKSLVIMQKARALVEKDDLGAAEKELLSYIKATREDPYLTDAQLMLGEIYTTSRRYEEAITAYGIIVQNFEKTRDPQLAEALAEAHYRLGEVHRELGRFQPALENFRKAADTFNYPIQGPTVPDYVVRSHFQAGDMLYELGENNEAIQQYQQATRLYPDSEHTPWANYQIGLTYRRMGEDRKALDIFNSLVELSKTKPGEMWESLARQNQRDLTNKLQYQDYMKQ